MVLDRQTSSEEHLGKENPECGQAGHVVPRMWVLTRVEVSGKDRMPGSRHVMLGGSGLRCSDLIIKTVGILRLRGVVFQSQEG